MGYFSYVIKPRIIEEITIYLFINNDNVNYSVLYCILTLKGADLNKTAG